MSLAQQQTWVAERYRLLEPLGSGGMGRVWLARDEVLRRDVAIKEIVPPDGLTEAEREELRMRTMREARAAARLNNPHVVRIYDVLQAQNRPWIVMEYVPSRSLHQVITEEGPLPPDRAAVIGIDVLAALKAAHLAGVLHRDVKPGNVLLADDGRVVLTDFGLAIFEGGDGAVTRPGLILGSPQYISPERAREGQSGPEADLWSLGATLYAAVEGRSPYARTTTFATLTALATEDPDPPHRAGVLRPVLAALLRKDPRSRAGIAETERLLRKAANTESRFRPWALPRPRKPREIESSSSGSSGSSAVNGANGVNGLNGSDGALAVGAPLPVESKPADNTPVTEDSEAVSQIGTTTAKPSVTFPGKVRGMATVPGTVIELGNPSPAAEPTPVHRRRRWALVGLTALLVLALLAGGLFLVDRRRGDRTQADSPPAPSASASVPATPSPTDQFGLVPGFHYYEDPTYHWRVGVPNGWQQQQAGDAEHPTMVQFDEPVLPRRRLGIERVITPPNPDAQAWTNADAAKAKKELPGYVVTRTKKIDGFYASATDWVYSYNTSEGRITVCERRVVISPSLGYIIFWSTSASQWKDNSENWQLLSVSFKPEPTP
jgi:serine/threonine protein kinase